MPRLSISVLGFAGGPVDEHLHGACAAVVEERDTVLERLDSVRDLVLQDREAAVLLGEPGLGLDIHRAADTEIRRAVVGTLSDAEVELVAVTVSHGNVWLRGRVGDLAVVPVLEESLRRIAGVTRIDLEVYCAEEEDAGS